MDTNKPFFSVVIPVYNKEPHIQRSVTSVLNQTFSRFELILVNDASTDNSLQEIKKFKDHRIKIYHRDIPGPGGYAGRNLGAEKANTNWIAFLDADDEWFPEHLSNFFKLINQHPNAAVLGCGWQTYSPDGLNKTKYFNPFYQKHSNKGNFSLSFRDYLQAEVAKQQPIWTSVACIKKSILFKAGGFPAGKCNRGGDVDTWLRCVEKAGGMAWSAHIGATYFRDSVNMVTSARFTFSEIKRVERESVDLILPRYSGTESKLLKKFANKRTIGDWKQNQHLKKIEKLKLLRKLYWSVDTINNIAFNVFSLLPSSVFRLVRKTYWEKKI